MKRLPILLSLCALIALSASLVYWLLQLYQPAQRPLAAAPASALAEPGVDAAATLFGGQASTALASNYQLTGVIVAGRDSVAIIVADGSPPKALKLGREVASGVTVQEVHPRYVLLSDGGVLKRIELATDAKVLSSAAALLPAPQQFQLQPPEPPPPQQEPTQQTQQPQQPQQPQAQDGAPTMPGPVDATAPPNAGAAPFLGTPPRPPAVQMPAPTRGVNTGGQQR